MTEENLNLLLNDGIHITKEAHDILSHILYRRIIELGENNKRNQFNTQRRILKK